VEEINEQYIFRDKFQIPKH